ncbi:Phenylacetone monooxygenase [Cercospora beticola]|uniref:Phenylacetone monooxygenase n=1 Tax=Cercospora beticola TaxID=122368 RepID=A0A2G5H7H1_CERBT|nr:Phenylacetone monooxygenase [Cercospora beticola]PIA88468.1 Phenylacetone monooxygenase [Cercospora beticola]WPB02755.1 hypothetical protein RHO25_007391 [Cercospora beticola]CAK1358567.1 unnamed protein product [Cercospora beticola]
MAVPDYDAVVVGAGFGGIRTMLELQALGISMVCFDAASDVGGTWWWNRYPGARSDGEASIYTLKFSKEVADAWDYSEKYPTQQEIQSYLARVVDHYDLRRRIQFNVQVVSAKYSDEHQVWTIETAAGRSFTCRYFIPATRTLSVPRDPPFKGLERFTGKVYQSSNWPSQGVSLEGKRVAIVGTGSTGVQLVPKLAPAVKQLLVLQRTPCYAIPGRNEGIDEFRAAEIKSHNEESWKLAINNPVGHDSVAASKIMKGLDPATIRQYLDKGWESGFLPFQLHSFADIYTDPESNEIISQYVRDKIHAIVDDQATADLLSPSYPFGTKRPTCEHGYYKTFNRSNVKPVDVSGGDVEVREKGLVTADGTQHEVDIIIFAVGFDAGPGALGRIDIQGSSEKSLKGAWAESLQTFAGVLVPEFPNMFIINGPHSSVGNQPTTVEVAVDWMGKVVAYMREHQISIVDVKQEAAAAWTQHVSDLWNFLLVSKPAAAARSWFVGANVPGKKPEILMYFGGIPNWRSWLDKEVFGGWASLKFTSPSG